MRPSRSPYKKLKSALPGPRNARWYQFGPFQLDPDAGVVLHGTKRLPLTPKAVETLRVLIEHAGTVVLTESLMDEVWPGSFVEIGSLTRNVSDLRKALGAEAASFIETVPKRGYRFAAPVSAAEPVKRSGAWRVCVQPVDSGHGERLDRRSLSVANAVVDKLVLVRGCEPRVVENAGHRRDADLLVQLEIRASKDLLRVGVRFIDGDSTSVIWAETLTQDADEHREFEDSIAEQVAGAAALWFGGAGQAKLLAKRYTVSNEAYRQYLTGHFHARKRSERGLREAVRCFKRSIDSDPEYSYAYSGLASTFALLPMLAPLDARHYMPKARAAAINALEIDETVAEARSALAFVKWHYDWDWRGAEREFRRILRFQPKDAVTRQWYALLLVESGRSSEALEHAATARRLASTSPAVRANVATVLHFAGRPNEAVREAAQVLRLDPASVRARLIMGLALEQQGRAAEAIRQFEEALAISPNAPALLGALGHAFAATGRTAAATNIAARLQRFPHPAACAYAKALTAVALGRTEDALNHVEQAAAYKDFQLVLANVDRRLNPLRGASRFDAILNRIRLA